MFLRQTRFQVLSFSFLLFILITGLSEAKTSIKDTKPSTKPWAALDGFRSAKFGMSEKQIKRIIAKDFKVSSSKVKRTVHPLEKTSSLEFSVPELLAAGGEANLGYVFGQKTRKLIQVNIIWGVGVSKKPDPQDVIAAANLLRAHFTKKRYQEEFYAVNAKINDSSIIAFRGKDKKGRMVLLTLNQPPSVDSKKKGQQVSLQLSYMLDPVSPDVLTIEEGDF